MRRPRLKAPEHIDRAIYHCVSRVVNREFVLGEQEKEQFVRLMRLYEDKQPVPLQLTSPIFSPSFIDAPPPTEGS